MENKCFAKKPAFFRAMSPELFFEADALESDVVTTSAASSAELEKLLENAETETVTASE